MIFKPKEWKALINKLSRRLNSPPRQHLSPKLCKHPVEGGTISRFWPPALSISTVNLSRQSCLFGTGPSLKLPSPHAEVVSGKTPQIAQHSSGLPRRHPIPSFPTPLYPRSIWCYLCWMGCYRVLRWCCHHALWRYWILIHSYCILDRDVWGCAGGASPSAASWGRGIEGSSVLHGWGSLASSPESPQYCSCCRL